MGLMLISMAARVGAISVTVVEPNADRHQLASILGATEVVSTVEQLEEEGRFDLVIDATGVIEAIEDGVRRVRQGGTFLQFGVASSERMASFSPYRLYHDEVTFVGSMAVLNSFDRARDLAVDADLGLAQLVSDTLPLSSYSDPTSAAQLLDRDPAPL
jgi:threonine dehydrogenase-like Zn-dependent dehydrogenase